jgi:hypothetical protein
MFNWLKEIWGVAKWLLPFLPKKAIGKWLVKEAREYAQKTENTWDDEMVERLAEFLSSLEWLPTEAEIVKELEKELKERG